MLAEMLKARRLPDGRRTLCGRALLLVGVLGVLLAGCGGGAATQRGAVLKLRIDEYHISPGSVRIHAGVLRIELTNSGVLDHEVEVSVFDGTHLYALTPTAHPGQTVLSSPFALRPGTYRLYDPVANYADLGAYGTLKALRRTA
jgi:hypothetical protein